MQKRSRNRVGSLTMAGLLATALVPAASSVLYAQRPTRSASGVEKNLAGIRILQSYKSVLDRFGAPSRIFRKDEIASYIYSRDANGLLTGGVTGYGDTTQSSGANLASAGPGAGGGMMASMGGRGGGMPGMGGPPAGAAGMMAAMSGRGGGMPGMGGPPAGGRSGDGEAGAPGASTAAAPAGNTFGDSGGFVWSYLDARAERVIDYHFNKDGRVETITEFGRFRNSVTARGISIGSTLPEIYRTYGWPDTTRLINNGEMTVLSYLQKHHFQVVLIKDKTTDSSRVSGLVVTLRENQNVAVTSGGASTGGRGGAAMMGGMGAMMGGGARGSAGAALGGRMMPGLAGMGGGGGKKGM